MIRCKRYYKDKNIPIDNYWIGIDWIQGMTAKEEKQIETMLKECVILPVDNPTKSKFIELRRKYKLRLPDAIIAATAIVSGIPLITADKQFRSISELDVIIYGV